MKDNGYWQAIDNLALALYRWSKEVYDPVIEATGTLDPDTIVQFAAAARTPEQEETYRKINEVMDVIAETHEIDRDVVLEDAEIQVLLFSFDE